MHVYLSSDKNIDKITNLGRETSGWVDTTQLELTNAYNLMHVCISYLQLFYTFIYSDIYLTKIQHLQVDRDHECEDEGDNKCSHFKF